MRSLPLNNITEKIFESTDEIVLRDENLFMELAVYINDLIKNDLDRLVGLLYRIDVNETKLREMLSANQSADSGNVIAAAIIERQIEKIGSRRDNSHQSEHIDENDRW